MATELHELKMHASSQIEVRLATSEDAQAISDALLSAFEEHRPAYTQAAFEATTPDASTILSRMVEGPVWVAVFEDQVVGTVAAVPKNGDLYIRSMAVVPSARGRNIGRILLERIEQYARENKLSRLYLCTTPFLSGAIALYERWGFARIENSDGDLAGTPIFSMEKMLTASTPQSASKRSTIKRKPERGVPDEARDFLARGVVAHVGFVQNDQPYVIPMTYNYDPATPDKLYLHGSYASRILKHLVSGAPICVTVTAIQGLVISKTAQGHSMNYETVICFGRAYPIKDLAEKAASFQNLIGRYHEGRIAGVHYEAPSKQELMAVSLVEVQIEEISAKARRGGPLGPGDDDPEVPGTAGVIPLNNKGL